jgi:hypothetical protein
MKHFLAFLKATLLGGVIVVFPAWLAVLLVLKALGHLEIFVKPISKHLPQAIGHPRVIAILVLVGLCFLVGLAIHTAIGRRIERAAERLVLDKIPGYTTLHGFAAGSPTLRTTPVSSLPWWKSRRRSFLASSSSGTVATVVPSLFLRCPRRWLGRFIS